MALTDEQRESIISDNSLDTIWAVASAIESAATAPLLARIAELEELNRLNNQIINTQHAAMVNAEQRGIAKGLEECAERIAALTAQVEQAAQPVAERWHVGDSAFESWYDQYLLDAPVHQGAKQKARDAYAAGMGERAATAPPKAVPLTDEQSRLATEAVNEVMAQAQVFASAYSLIGSRFDGGNAQYDSDEEKAELRAMVVSLAYEAAHGITPATVEKGGA